MLLSFPCLAESDSFLISLSKKFNLSTKAQDHLGQFCKAPHPFGSKRQQELAEWLLKESDDFAVNTRLQKFEALTPNPKNFPKIVKGEPLTVKRRGQNVLAQIPLSKNPRCFVIAGSHYDSKHLEGLWSVGANDSGSTSVLLLEIGRYLRQIKNLKPAFECDLLLVWFDGEEAILPEWNDGQRRYAQKIHDNTYGSRHFVSQMQTCGQNKCVKPSQKYDWLPVRYMVLLDMLGSKDIAITDDLNSSLKLRRRLKSNAKLLGDLPILAARTQSILDDHIPFLQAGIPSLNIIDFENLHRWHKPTDTHEHVHLPSLNRAGRLALLTLLQLLHKP
ncbi:MAG: M28 family peptidase [Oligoflexales bacterium]|nr:M28 family peptidase [Oligoflexales bacterium]